MYKESYLSVNEHTTAKKSIQECKNAVKQIHKHRIFIRGYFPLHRDNSEIIKGKTLIDLNQISQINEIIMEKPKRKHNENKVTTRGMMKTRSSSRREAVGQDENGMKKVNEAHISRKKANRKQTIGGLPQTSKGNPYATYKMDEFQKLKKENSEFSTFDIEKIPSKRYIGEMSHQGAYKPRSDEFSRHKVDGSSFSGDHYMSPSDKLNKDHIKQPTKVLTSLLYNCSTSDIKALLNAIQDYLQRSENTFIDWDKISNHMSTLTQVTWTPQLCHYLWRLVAYNSEQLKGHEKYGMMDLMNDEDLSDDDMINYHDSTLHTESKPHAKVSTSLQNPPRSMLYLPKHIKPNSNLNASITHYPSLYPLPTQLTTKEKLEQACINNETIQNCLNAILSVAHDKAGTLSGSSLPTSYCAGSGPADDTAAPLHSNTASATPSSTGTDPQTSTPSTSDSAAKDLSAYLNHLNKGIKANFFMVIEQYLKFYSFPFPFPKEYTEKLYDYISSPSFVPVASSSYTGDSTDFFMALYNMKEILADVERTKFFNYDAVYNDKLPLSLLQPLKEPQIKPATSVCRTFLRSSNVYKDIDSLLKEEQSTKNISNAFE